MNLRSLLVLLSFFLTIQWTWSASIETVAGSGREETKDGHASLAGVNNPFGIVRGPNGAFWFCEYGGHTVRRIDGQGNVTTVVGNGNAGYAGDGGSPLKASLNKPHEIRFDREGNLYIADMSNNAIRKVDLKSGIITTIAGTGQSGFSGDGGPADRAQLKSPHSIQFGPDGRLFIADVGNNRIRAIDMASGTIDTLSGDGSTEATIDGEPFATASLNGPRSIDFDRKGDMWLVLRNGNQVFRLDLRAGTLHHMAGTGEKGFSGNGGPARLATLSGQKGIALAPNGDAYLADTESHSIRMIEAATGNLVLIAGTGSRQDGPDGDPLGCGLARPHGVFWDTDGALYVGDSENHRIRVLRW
jgi:streptogramin lyase